MNYSDKVQAAINSAHDTAIANKILDMMQDLILKNDENTARRWIWELIQNAKDVSGSSGMINIKIDFNECERYLSFKHDGKCFTTENIVHLISQVSSKERNQSPDNGVTGKFGTGFLTTHLLSQKVVVNAFLQDENEPLKEIHILLDRSGETKEQVIAAVNESFRQLEKSKEIDISVLEETAGFNTCFLYELGDRGIEIAKNGLKSFYASIPYVFAFVGKINSIKVNDSLYIERGEKGKLGIAEVHTIYISENGIKDTLYILSYHEEKIDLAIPIKVKNNEIYIDEYSKNVPKLFCTFPLIGTEDFSFPVIVNSAYFNPNDPRSGIYLTDVENKVVDENKNLISQALNAYKNLLNYVAEHHWKQVYNVVHIPRQPQKDWLSKDWFAGIIEECKQHIKYVEIVDTESGERRSLYDSWDNSNIFIIGDNETIEREQVWELVKPIYPDCIVPFLDIHKWYSSLWLECRNFNMHTLVQTIEEYGCLETLELNLNNSTGSIAWLNDLYEALINSKNVEEYKNAKIYPNQLGQFCSINELYRDNDIEDVYKQILSLLGNECKEILLDKGIRLSDNISCRIYDYDMLFCDILEAMNNNSFSEREAMAKIITLYNEETKVEEQLDLLKLLEKVFAEEISNAFEVQKINTEVMEKARKYWCNEMADEVADCQNIAVLAYHLNLSEEDAFSWLRELIEYFGRYNHKNLFERKTKPIIPNQNGDFIIIEAVFLDSGEIDDIFKDILAETGNDLRRILLPVNIYLELPESRVKELKDVVQGITEYVKQNQGLSKNQNDTVRNNFNRLFYWINDNPDKAKLFFKEIIDNKHWLIDDEEIAQNMKKAEKYDSLLKRYNIQSERDLENILKVYSQENDDAVDDKVEISEELMIQYGISSIEEFVKAQQYSVFKENFIHVSESDRGKFDYVKSILERAKTAIFNYLATLEDYDVATPIEVTNTIFIIKKYGKEMVLITRPSDYGQVILYYGAEKDTLDFEKDYELWVEDGIEQPQQITFGKMLKLTGINRIPLRKVR
ncbi:MAG: hypothetical protein HDR05_08495 [Lachnospiraceae bacterium]|nr:hypothetical protein [Lachnospiraceae bacterium]